jgi:KDO2-lipid IV(A) lauroyltransferase
MLNRRARDTFREFGGKLADLLLFESGVSLDAWVEPGNGWQHFDAARASGKGVLLVTIHLGNWELGSVLLRRMGLSPLVLTAPEPTAELTQLRLAARERLGIETLVVGENPFQFVEVIKRLQDGGVVAILVDRPPIEAAVPSPFLGGTTGANIATAELARATGCIILPVYVVRHGSNYLTHVLKPVEYERGNLGSRETRRDLASRVLQVFEPAVLEHPEQWYHFVPIWTQTSDSTQ